MARASARVRNPAGHVGLIDNAIGLVSALFAYVETRAALLAVESKAMLLQLAAVVALALGALIAVVFGYIFILASLIAGIAHRSGISWTWIALGAGLLHIVVAVVCVLRAKDSSKENGRGLLEAGALVGVLKFAVTLLRPALMKFVTRKLTGYSRTRSQTTR